MRLDVHATARAVRRAGLATLMAGLLAGSGFSPLTQQVATARLPNQTGPGPAPKFAFTPTLDGAQDEGYIAMAGDFVGDLASPGPADWEGVAWADLSQIWAAADSTDLYLQIPVYHSSETSEGGFLLAIDTDSAPNSGGATDPWGNAITFAYQVVDGITATSTLLPDYVIRGNVNNINHTNGSDGYAELRKWANGNWDTGAGVNWGGIITGLAGTNIAWADNNGVEFRIPYADIGVTAETVSRVRLQFISTQNAPTKGAYDTVPSDDQSTGWDDPTTQTRLASLPLTLDEIGDLPNPGPGGWEGTSWTDQARLYVWNDHTTLNVYSPFDFFDPARTGQIGLVIDTGPGGGPSDPWGNAITFAYTSTYNNTGLVMDTHVTTTTLLPNYVIRGNVAAGAGGDGWTELRHWANGNWDTGAGVNWGGLSGSATCSPRICWTRDGVRISIPLADLGLAAEDEPAINLQFFTTQSGAGKGAYDTLPFDDQSDEWDDPTTQKRYATYRVADVPAFVASHDNNVFWDGLYHDSRDTAYRTPGGPQPAGTPVTLRLRAYKNDLTGVTLRAFDKVANSTASTPMQRVATDATYEWWQATITPTAPTLLYYRFIARDGTAVAYYEDNSAIYGSEPWKKGGPGQVYAASPDLSFQLTVFDPTYVTPDWLRNGVMYQIFPDRFRDGNPANDPQAGRFFYDQPGGAITRSNQIDWNVRVCDPRDVRDPECLDKYSHNFYGGDLAGITEKVNDGYFDQLGVNVLYLNPIFRAPSNHKYDTQDYTQIDPDFGTEADWNALVAAADTHGIHIILDAVFNHTSSDSYYFDRYHRWDAEGNLTSPGGVGTNDFSGACEAITSTFRAWYFFQPDPGGPCAGPATYTSWFGYDSLPKLDAANPIVRSYFYSGPVTASIATRWVISGASGWRFDVGGDVDPGYANDPANGYYIGLRNAVRGVYSQTALLLEEWNDNSPWLLGNQMDGAMNYRLRKALIGFVRDSTWTDNDNNGNNTIWALSPSELEQSIQVLLEDYPEQAVQAMMNLLGSHDTNRVRFVLKSDSGGPLSDEQVDAKQRLLVALLYGLPGAPTTYYADEAGASEDGVLSGGRYEDDPYNRLPFPWDDTPGFYVTRTGMLDYYAALGQARRAHPALRTGDYVPLLADDGSDAFAYGRVCKDACGTANGDAAIVVLNRGVTQTVAVSVPAMFVANGAVFSDVVSGLMYTVTAGALVVGDLPQNQAAFLVLAEGQDIQAGSPPTISAMAGNGKVTIVFTDTASPDSASFNLYRSLFSGGYQLVATGVTTSPYTDTTITNGATYYYVMTSVDSSGNESGYSNEAVATPSFPIGSARLDAPETLTHTLGITPTPPIQARVNVTGVTDVAGSPDAIRAELGFGDQGTDPATWTTWTPMSYTAAVSDSFVYQAALTPEVTGTFDLLARFSTDGGLTWVYADRDGYSPGGDSGTDNPGTLVVLPSDDTEPPAAPQNLRVIGWSTSNITLEWDPVGDDDLYAYDVFRSTVSDTVEARVGRVLSATTVFTDDQVSTGITYQYVVRAIDVNLNASAPSNQVSQRAEPRLVRLTFSVQVPAFTPPGDMVYIAGDNASVFGQAWNPSYQPMTQTDDLTWTVTLTAPDAIKLQYKYTRGSWDKVEWWGDIINTTNRELTVTYGMSGEQSVNDAVGNWRDPIIVTTTPPAGATNVPTSTHIAATFSRDIDAASVTTATLPVRGDGQVVSGAYGVVSATVTFTPAMPLAPATWYSVTATSGVKGTDNGGTGVQGSPSWSFRTRAGTVTTGTVGHITMTVEPPTLPADGIATATVSVTVTDEGGEPMSGATVVLLPPTLVSPNVGATDGSGVFTATLNARTFPGAVAITAISQGQMGSAVVTFTSVFTPGAITTTFDVNTDTAAVGDVVTYTLVVSNAGPGAATDLLALASVPQGADLITDSVSGGNVGGVAMLARQRALAHPMLAGSVTFIYWMGSLNAGESHTITYAVRVTSVTGSLSAVASVFAGNTVVATVSAPGVTVTPAEVVYLPSVWR